MTNIIPKKTKAKQFKIKKIKPYTRNWERLANELARSWVQINSCIHCGYPVVHGYCCGKCGSVEP